MASTNQEYNKVKKKIIENLMKEKLAGHDEPNDKILRLAL